MKQVIFTDLDGTLLDRANYSYAKALPAIERAKEKNIPIVFCSAKTRAEQEVYRKKLELFHPFVVENGGAVFIPSTYFPFQVNHHKVVNDLLVIELALPYHKIKELLDNISRENDIRFRTFGKMTATDITKAAGLSIELARLAKLREYSETIKFDSRGEETKRALEKIKEAGLDWYDGGRFYHIMAKSDKRRAVTVLIDLYRQLWGQIRTIGIGDGPNDLPMLSAVDMPILVQKENHTWEKIDLPGLRRVPGEGPEGWANALKEILEG